MVDLWRLHATQKEKKMGEMNISSVISQKGESQNGCFKKTKNGKFSEKQTFTP